MSWSHYLFSFDGRINRAKWWLFLLVVFAYIVASTIMLFVFGMITPVLAFIWGIVFLIGCVVLIYASFAVGVKRLHDRGKSGLWLLAFYVLPYVIGVVAFWTMLWGVLAWALQMGSEMPNPAQAQAGLSAMMGAWWLYVIYTVIWVWALIELGILKGTDGSNQYGADPLRAI